MRNALVIGTLVVVAVATTSAVAQTPPQAEPAAQAVASPELPNDELGLLTEILEELRGLRTEIRNLQRTLQQQSQPRPTPTPVPLPASIELGTGQTLGKTDAKVAILEFSEFQCLHCKRYQETFAKVKESYVDTGKVRYEFRDFPLVSIHPQARSAALAARCAGEQGAFWRMHDELFKAQATLGPDLYPQLAKTLGLDAVRFQKCLADPKQDKALGDAIAAAEALGVRGTPHFYVGQVRAGNLVSVRALGGALPFESFRAAVDALLVQAAGAPPAVPAR